jgi:hypothetical protein
MVRRRRIRPRDTDRAMEPIDRVWMELRALGLEHRVQRHIARVCSELTEAFCQLPGADVATAREAAGKSAEVLAGAALAATRGPYGRKLYEQALAGCVDMAGALNDEHTEGAVLSVLFAGMDQAWSIGAGAIN